jgi:vacuolar-type H+-ATPase subunit I/STV1
MKSGNPVPGANAHDGDVPEDADGAPGQQVRAIQEIIAQLESVTKRLAHPLRTLPQPRGPQPPGRS